MTLMEQFLSCYTLSVYSISASNTWTTTMIMMTQKKVVVVDADVVTFEFAGTCRQIFAQNRNCKEKKRKDITVIERDKTLQKKKRERKMVSLYSECREKQFYMSRFWQTQNSKGDFLWLECCSCRPRLR